jgi:putative acyl-CoA dehydrogenase
MTVTHEVFNQAQPWVGANLFEVNLPLQAALRRFAPGFDATSFGQLGQALGSAEVQEHARLANTHDPVLKTHDRVGRRVDQVEFHPSYHALMQLAMRHGLHATPWGGAAGSHVERAAKFMLFTEAEPSVLCPISMTYAVWPALAANPAIQAQWRTGLRSLHYDPRFLTFDQKTGLTMGMAMTEKQGGSDLRANTTRAVPDGSDAWGQRFRISGHKWFCSAPMCDAFLVLAQTTSGVSCFFMPRLLPDGAVNAFHIQRLKDKLGNRANASSEPEFHDAAAWLVGDEGRGIPQILNMGMLTRLDCALGTAGLMRQALSIALNHANQRQAFGKCLIEQPLMRNVLADLALESEAATLLALRLAAAVDRTENGQDADGHEALIRRVLTPVAKFWVCKRGSHFAQEAMECLGGNGYVEEGGGGVMARIYREMPLNSIWEGAGNIMAIDLLRALRSGPVAQALVRELAPAKGAHPAFDRVRSHVLQTLEDGVAEPQARRLARDVALLLQAGLMFELSTPACFAAFCQSRFADNSDVFGLLDATCDTNAILGRAMPS